MVRRDIFVQLQAHVIHAGISSDGSDLTVVLARGHGKFAVALQAAPGGQGVVSVAFRAFDVYRARFVVADVVGVARSRLWEHAQLVADEVVLSAGHVDSVCAFSS